VVILNIQENKMNVLVKADPKAVKARQGHEGARIQQFVASVKEKERQIERRAKQFRREHNLEK
jgi:hypothetical protein